MVPVFFFPAENVTIVSSLADTVFPIIFVTFQSKPIPKAVQPSPALNGLVSLILEDSVLSLYVGLMLSDATYCHQLEYDSIKSSTYKFNAFSILTK